MWRIDDNGIAYRDTEGGARLFILPRFHVIYETGGIRQSWTDCNNEDDAKQFIKDYVQARNSMKENHHDY